MIRYNVNLLNNLTVNSMRNDPSVKSMNTRSGTTLRAVAGAWIAALALVATASSARAADPILTVAYAGSMGALMDQGLGPAIQQHAHVQFQGHGGGAYGLARLLADKALRADVFVSITPGPIEVLQKAGLISQAVPVASTQMVIAYSPKGPHAAEFAAAAGTGSWVTVLTRPGMKFGRTDPTTDPQGRNIVLAMMLAENFYKRPGLAKAILGDVQHNTAEIFSEPSLLSRLESGQIDASSGYLSAVLSHHLPYIKLPAEVNLGDPAMVRDWYDKAHFNITMPDGKTSEVSTQPLVFYAAVLRNAANPGAGAQFVRLMQDPQGQALFKQFGYSRPKGGVLR